MWKIAVGFIAFAGLALFILNKGGDIDMGGEKHGAEATHAADHAPAAPAAAASVAVLVPPAASASAAAVPAAAASK